jgi:hypothetical protein
VKDLLEVGVGPLTEVSVDLARWPPGGYITPDARAICGIAVNQSNSIAGSPTLLGLANLAVRAGSGCPREGFKKARK